MIVATRIWFVSRSSRFLLLAVVLAAATPRSHADEARLAWEACVADGGTTNTSFACDTNEGFHSAVASFVLDGPITMSGPRGVEGELRVGNYGTTSHLDADWWRLSSDGCRPGALTSSADFVSADGACLDPWFRTGFTSMTPYTFVVTPDRPPHGSSSYGAFRIQVASLQPLELLGGAEYLAFRIRINHSRTVGENACSGCCQNQDWMLDRLTFYPDTGPQRDMINTPYISWQGFGSGCGPTPAKSLSLGQLRSIYR